MQIHVLRGSEKFGPYSLEEVTQYLADGSLLPSDVAWHEGIETWVPITEMLDDLAAKKLPPPASSQPTFIRVNPKTNLWWVGGIIIGIVLLVLVYYIGTLTPSSQSNISLGSTEIKLGDPIPQPIAAIPFQGGVYTALDNSEIITLTSPDELEFSSGGANIIGKYTKQQDSLRAILTVMGTERALYYRIINVGLQDNQGKILYDTSHLENARKRVQLSDELCIACLAVNTNQVEQICDQIGDVNVVTHRGTPLTCVIQAACSNNKPADAKLLLEYLLKKGANPNTLDLDGMSPLWVAIRIEKGYYVVGQPETTAAFIAIVKQLIASGADVNFHYYDECGYFIFWEMV